MTDRSFKAWLADQAERHDWIGHFGCDAKDDAEFPEGASLTDLHRYLTAVGAMEQARTALEAAWEGWSASAGERQISPFEAENHSKGRP